MWALARAPADLRVEANQAAEFPTMLPHAIGTAGVPTEILGIFDRDARRGHQDREPPPGRTTRSRDLSAQDTAFSTVAARWGRR